MTTDEISRDDSARAQLLDAAIDLVGAGAISDATPARIEQAAGLADGSLAREVGDDDAWLLATLEHLCARRLRQYEDALDGLAAHERTLEGAAEAIWRFFPGPIWTAWLQLFLEVRRRPQIRERAVAITTELDKGIGRVLPRFFDAETRETAQFAGLVLIHLDGMALAKFVTEGLFDFDAILLQLQHALTAVKRATMA